MKTDLHIHTKYSDGRSAPADIVRIAAYSGYDEIAITDHDGLLGLPEAAQAGKRYGIRVIAGIEIKALTPEGYEVHILGHDIEYTDPAIIEWTDRLMAFRKERNVRLASVLGQMGYDVDLDELHRAFGEYVGKPHIARSLVAKGRLKTYSQAFEEGVLFETDAARTVKTPKFSDNEVIDVIHKAGGHAVLAHPIKVKNTGFERGSPEYMNLVSNLISDLKARGMEGLECYHKDQNSDESYQFVKMACENGMYITRGSDFHGEDYGDPPRTAEIPDDVEIKVY